MATRIIMLIAATFGATICLANENKSKFSLGFDYQSRVAYSDNGYSGEEDPSHSTLIDASAYFRLSKKVDEKGNFEFVMDLLPKGKALSDTVEIASFEQKFGSIFSIVVGKQYLNLGGMESDVPKYLRVYESAYLRQRLPFTDVLGSDSATSVAIQADGGAFGELSIQMVDDVVPTDSATDDDDLPDFEYFNDSPRQPAAIVEWKAEYAGIRPLLQFSSYDLNHSLYLGAGVSANLSHYSLALDYILDQRAYRDNGEEKKLEQTSIVANIGADLGVVRPFLKFSQFKVVQPDLDGIGNSSLISYDDNNQSVTFGTFFFAKSRGETFVPYLSWTQQTQKVAHNPRNPLVAESYSETVILFGQVGHF